MINSYRTFYIISETAHLTLGSILKLSSEAPLLFNIFTLLLETCIRLPGRWGVGPQSSVNKCETWGARGGSTRTCSYSNRQNCYYCKTFQVSPFIRGVIEALETILAANLLAGVVLTCWNLVLDCEKLAVISGLLETIVLPVLLVTPCTKL